MSAEISQIVANNAAWIQMVTAALGIGGEFTPILWQNTHDMPPIFPHADILGGTVEEQIAAIQALVDARAGRVVAVKDAWAQLDLAPLGFEALFTADWLYCEPQALETVVTDMEIEYLRTADALRDFALACNGEDISPEVYHPSLLDNPKIMWLVGKRQGQIVTGLTMVSAAGLIGINNLFGANDADLKSILGLALQSAEGIPVCGYESSEEKCLPYLELGFQKVGQLRVWLRF